MMRAMPVPPHIVGSPATTARRPKPRERVLIAAESVWGELGYAQARIEDVLKVADVSRATFYQNFAGKEDVAAALLDRAIAVLLSSVAARTQLGKTFPDKVERALDAYLELWQQHGRIIQELTVEALRPGSTLGPVRKRAVDAVVDVLSHYFYVERGFRIERMVALHLALGIEAALMHLQLEKPLTAARRTSVRAEILALVLDTVGRPSRRRRT
jgi:AcrR family transcriptional regulator